MDPLIFLPRNYVSDHKWKTGEVFSQMSALLLVFEGKCINTDNGRGCGSPEIFSDGRDLGVPCGLASCGFMPRSVKAVFEPGFLT